MGCAVHELSNAGRRPHKPIQLFLVSYMPLAPAPASFFAMLASLARRAPTVHRIASRTMPTIPGTLQRLI